MTWSLVNPNRDDFRKPNWVVTIQVAVINKIETLNWNVIKVVRIADLLIPFLWCLVNLKIFNLPVWILGMMPERKPMSIVKIKASIITQGLPASEICFPVVRLK